MAYALHIERIDPAAGERIPIKLAEWRSAVAVTEGLRFATEPANARNPATGVVISIPNAEGDVEIDLPGEGWVHAFRWTNRGTAIFRATDDLSHPIHCKAIELARRLHAIVRGDEGERYS